MCTDSSYFVATESERSTHSFCYFVFDLRVYVETNDIREAQGFWTS
jgi:hypothetical protein